MGKRCVAVTKYFLFFLNLIFFLFGLLILGFGLWVLLDNKSFIVVLQESSNTLKVASYILIGVGSLSIIVGFLGCVGAIYEIRCLLGMYFTCLLLILIAQVTAGVLVYFQRDLLKNELSGIANKIIVNYTGQNKTTDQAWDYIQRTVHCCGWTGPGNWTENLVIKNSSHNLFPCSCFNTTSTNGNDIKESGFCEGTASHIIYAMGCISSMENWLFSNLGIILGFCAGVAFIELLGMILSLCLCKSVHQEDYTKVPKY